MYVRVGWILVRKPSPPLSVDMSGHIVACWTAVTQTASTHHTHTKHQNKLPTRLTRLADPPVPSVAVWFSNSDEVLRAVSVVHDKRVRDA